MTRKQLARFVKTRNKSAFVSNLQFQIDANACGFSVEDLGPVTKFTLDGFSGYQWKPETKDAGQTRLVEFGGHAMHLEGDPASAELFELMNTAQFEQIVTQPPKTA